MYNNTPTFAIDLAPAFEQFLSTLAAAKQNDDSWEYMNTVANRMQIRLSEKKELLKELAAKGLVENACSMLDIFLQRWSQMSALIVILERDEWVDPNHEGVKNAFWALLKQQHAELASDLLIAYQQGIQERAQAAAQNTDNLIEKRIQNAQQTIEKQSQFNASLLTSFTNVVEKYNAQSNATSENNRKTLEVAIKATEKMGDTIEKLVDPAKEIIVQAGAYAKQNTPDYWDKALERASARRATRRIWFVLLIGGIVLASIILVFVGMMNFPLHHP